MIAGNEKDKPEGVAAGRTTHIPIFLLLGSLESKRAASLERKIERAQ